MQQDILIIGVLFSAIPFMVVNFANYYRVLATLIRHLHDEVIRDSLSPNEIERFFLQLRRLGERFRLIGIIQSCAAITIVLAIVAIITVYFDERLLSSLLFLTSMLLPMGWILCFTREIQIANAALEVHLSDNEALQELQQYLKPRHSNRSATKKLQNGKG